MSDVGTIDTEIGHNLNRPSSLPHSDMEPTQCRNWSLCYDKSVVLSEVHKIYEVTAAEFIFFCFDRHFFADDEFFLSLFAVEWTCFHTGLITQRPTVTSLLFVQSHRGTDVQGFNQYIE